MPIPLDKLDALPKSEQPASRTLAARGITPEERARVRALLKTATSYQPVDAEKDEAAKASREQSLAERDAALRVLRVWCEEWSTIARQLIRRKDWLIALGLASRKRPKKPAPVV